ncbi:hypothetical protein YB2330_001775 [Saitoella coloradoensis]
MGNSVGTEVDDYMAADDERLIVPCPDKGAKVGANWTTDVRVSPATATGGASDNDVVLVTGGAVVKDEEKYDPSDGLYDFK